MSKYKPGDVVRLASGGPPMTVSLCDLGDVTVSWFAQRDVVQSHTFPEGALVPAAPEPPRPQPQPQPAKQPEPPKAEAQPKPQG